MKKRYFLSADVVRVVAMLMVVEIHTVMNFTLRVDFFNTKLWWLLEPLSTISRTGVLLFFMLSGFLVLTKKRGLGENWRKTRDRILFPLFFFELVNIGYAGYRYNFSVSSLQEFWQWQFQRLTHFPSSPLWFLVVLVPIYLLNPIWQLIMEDDHKYVARYVTGLAFGFSVAISLVMALAGRGGEVFNSFTAWIGFLCFYLYGGLVRRKRVKYRNQILNMSVVLISWIVMVGMDFWKMSKQISGAKFGLDEYSSGFLGLPSVLAAVFLFNFLMALDYKSVYDYGINKIVRWLAGLSFGIYLIHVYVVSVFTDILGFHFDNLRMNVYLYNVLNFSLVLGVSVVLVLGIQRLSLTRRIIGEK